MACPDEARIHALLDGALPLDAARALERHITECAGCRDARDAAADLRDAATGVLARATASPRRMPTFATLQRRAEAAARATQLVASATELTTERHAAAAARTPQHRRLAAQAAGVAAAACLGWFAYGRAAAPAPPDGEIASSLAAPSQTSADTAPRLPRAARVRRAVLTQDAAAETDQARIAMQLPASHFPRPVTITSEPLDDAQTDRAPARVEAPPSEPSIGIVALEPGASAGTLRIDTEFRLDEGSEDEDVFADLELPVLREPVRSPMPSALLRVRAVSNAVDTLAGRSLLRRP